MKLLRSKNLFLLLIFTAYYFSYSQTNRYKIKEINTCNDEYAPFLLKKTDGSGDKPKPWRIYYSQSDIKTENGNTNLNYIDVTYKTMKSTDAAGYEIDIDFLNSFEISRMGTFKEEEAILNYSKQSILTTSAKSNRINQYQFMNDGYVSAALPSCSVDERIKKDFDGAYVSHLTYRAQKFIFFTSDIDKVERKTKDDDIEIKSKGGYDIWYYLWLQSSDSWWGPFNLENVNTSGDEIAPVLDYTGEFIFFSSNSEEYESFSSYKKDKPKINSGFDIYFSKIPEENYYSNLLNTYMNEGLPIQKGQLLESIINLDKSYDGDFVVNSYGDDLFFMRLDEKQALYCSDMVEDPKSVNLGDKCENRNFDVILLTPIPKINSGLEVKIQVVDCEKGYKPKQDFPIDIYKLENKVPFLIQTNTLSDKDGYVYIDGLPFGEYLVKPNAAGTQSKYNTEIFFDWNKDKQVNKYNSHIMKIGKCDVSDTIRLVINFDVDMANLNNSALNILKENYPKIRSYFRQYPNTFAYVEGHTSKEAKRDYNCNLSGRRAETVMNWLIAELYSEFDGDFTNKFRTIQYGECKPYIDEFDKFGKILPDNRPLNRRVEVLIYSEGNNSKINNSEMNCYDCQESGN